jgi:hypothetical protein
MLKKQEEFKSSYQWDPLYDRRISERKIFKECHMMASA